jgi:hypothetical protein
MKHQAGIHGERTVVPDISLKRRAGFIGVGVLPAKGFRFGGRKCTPTNPPGV